MRKQAITKIIREGNMLSLSGNILMALLGIVGYALLARSLSTEAFGAWVLLATAGAFIDMFRFGITNTALVRFLSGATGTMRQSIIGSNMAIGIVSTLITVGVVCTINSLFRETIAHSSYHLFFAYYPWIAIANLPWNAALVLLQADQRFDRILMVRALNGISFLLVILFHMMVAPLSLEQLSIALIGTNALTSIICSILGWDGLNQLQFITRQSIQKILHFGKYTAFTLAGTNLLRSADTFIISLSAMGGEAVALYSIPLKLTEILQVPLRSFAATAFPRMSRASMEGKNIQVRSIFYEYAGALSIMFLLFGCFNLIFAAPLVSLLGGSTYLWLTAADGFTAVDLVRILSVYGMLLPIDRMTGIALDSINRPQVNARKVLIMLLANVAGDLVAVFYYHSLALVAVSSIVFTLLGIMVGMQFLNKDLSARYSTILVSGIGFYKTLAAKMTKIPAIPKAL